MEIKARTRKWGNSIVIVIPRHVAKATHIVENEEIVVYIRKRLVAGDLFGKSKRKSKRTAQQIKDDMRAGWD